MLSAALRASPAASAASLDVVAQVAVESNI